jgi:CheY-like chemotaxis protein
MNARLDADDVARHPETLPGDYVVLSVSDTGRGMSVDTAQRAFEPFFTTKAVGEGSGLGLSMVYGFAKQSGGHVSLCSEPGRGTTVKLYLPRAQGEGRAVRSTEAPTVMPRGSETILVVEDNEDMRDITREQLQRLGYQVIAVGSAAAGRQALERHPDVALVLCDIVLGGGMSGPDFAATVIDSHPDVGVVFMSGYSGRAAAEALARFPSPSILPKPFAVDELARLVRTALDRTAA